MARYHSYQIRDTGTENVNFGVSNTERVGLVDTLIRSRDTV
ncbi:hypothetical protein CCACVL1_25130 [Corchorus capsularis]|uniref:Uncharacterized protein n=1 Tax=Corchorus capsularis TaxID=210143 RepID=A0A1R3GLQ5_COCAP|nr:hypothetical protein CCACVL1_25130 [Corchorus capsularis]